MEIVQSKCSVFLQRRVVLGWTSHNLEWLCSFDLLLNEIILSLLGIFDPLLDVNLQVFFRESLFLLCALNGDKDFFRMRLGFLDGNIRILFLLLLSLLKGSGDFMLGSLALFSDHPDLRCFVKFFRLLLCFLNNGVDKLRSLLDSHFHPLIKSIPYLDGLLLDVVASSLPGSGQSLIGDLTNFFGLL